MAKKSRKKSITRLEREQKAARVYRDAYTLTAIREAILLSRPDDTAHEPEDVAPDITQVRYPALNGQLVQAVLVEEIEAYLEHRLRKSHRGRVSANGSVTVEAVVKRLKAITARDRDPVARTLYSLQKKYGLERVEATLAEGKASDWGRKI